MRVQPEEVLLHAAQRPVDLGEGLSNAMKRVHDVGKVYQAGKIMGWVN